MQTRIICWSVLALFSCQLGLGDSFFEIKKDLSEFNQNSRAFMTKIPLKRDRRGHVVTGSWFNHRDIASGRYRWIKSRLRMKHEPRLFGDTFSEVQIWDHAEDLVDVYSYRDFVSIERAAAKSGVLAVAPWSDSYWPTYAGQLANRYADPQFPHSVNWKENADYLLNALKRPVDLDALSPAEKYDLLVGDSNWTLTKAMIESGRGFFEREGTVETWMGLCHGWAAASYMMERPRKAVDLLATDGKTTIRFFPADIKALETLLWANEVSGVKFVGRRCDVQSPKMDSNGRIIDPDCLDTNPATFHQVITNQISASHRSFVMDASFDFQVWNQPVVSYETTYFNPQTLEPVPDLQQATVEVSQFVSDKFKGYRSSQAKFIVGVSALITYVNETWPTLSLTNTVDQDARQTVRYLYDIELNDQGEMIGGEWYQNAHPDFLWTPPVGMKASTYGDREIDRLDTRSKWTGGLGFPASWRKAVQIDSRGGVPLARVVELLVKLSQ